MTESTICIELLTLPASNSDVQELAGLLVDAVASGAAVSFLAPLTQHAAGSWWQKMLSTSHPGAIFLVARDATGIVGTVQLHPAWAPNQPFRADIAKLIVHRRARGTGIGLRLMQAIQDAAQQASYRLLTLDAKRGAAAEKLYQRMGWIHVGTIPNFALDTDGVTLHDDAIYYKTLIDDGDSKPLAS
jgi:acetyltransferase